MIAISLGVPNSSLYPLFFIFFVCCVIMCAKTRAKYVNNLLGKDVNKMSNHIEAKFFNLLYSKIPNKKFNDSLETMIETFRREFPTYKIENINDIKINLSANEVAHEKILAGRELYMIDENGKFGLKIGNQGISMSISGYATFKGMVKKFESICSKTSEVLNISHFSKVELRNINIFKVKHDNENSFEDIKNSEIWGRQDFESLRSDLLCSGAATRHEYISKDSVKTLNIASAIVLPGRSYIPQEEWIIWNLRGTIPTFPEAKLLIDIVASHHQFPLNKPEKQNNVSKFKWEKIQEQLKVNHQLINDVYDDITE